MDNEDVQLSEIANNNLHIWELAKMFQQLDPAEGWSLLAPKEVKQTIIANLKPDEVASVTSDIVKPQSEMDFQAT